jgi:hypothetical protein
MTAMSDEPIRQPLAWSGRAVAAYAAHQSVRFLFGIAGLAFGGALLSFAIGIGLTDVALEAFWPYCNNGPLERWHQAKERRQKSAALFTTF